MKTWVQKLVEQIDFKWGRDRAHLKDGLKLSDERATILYFIDTLNKHLIDVDAHPTRAVREALDVFAKDLIQADDKSIEKVLFRIRQFFGSYRIAETSYIQTTFDDFRRIILDFVDQLGEDLSDEKKEDVEVKARIDHLKEAIESNSIDILRTQSREFIDTYVQIQAKKEKRRNKRVESVRKNLDVMKKQLTDAHTEMKFDHLTGAHNRRSFDEYLRALIQGQAEKPRALNLVTLDIDHFKKVNDTYGHDTGDFILQECVKMIQSVFPSPGCFVARIGGEEFAVVMPDYTLEAVIKKADTALKKIRAETYIKGEYRINFTVSMGIAQWVAGEKMDQWLKRADKALYHSKNSGRNKYSVAPHMTVAETAS